MQKSKVLDYIFKISPMARDFVEENYDSVKIIYEIEDCDNEGVFLKVSLDDLCIYYASFIDDSPLEILIHIKEELGKNPFTKPEICFNVNGNNTRIIEFVQVNNFYLDMEGHILKYYGETPSMPVINDLTIKGYEPDNLELFVELFESAYAQLNIDNGWDAKYYSKYKEVFSKELYDLNNHQLVKSLWKDDCLIGCYIIYGNFIKDIVVHPRFQSCGYGAMLLKHCLHHMKINKAINDIILRVAKSNVRAKHFYERNGFEVISWFAEHTYRKG